METDSVMTNGKKWEFDKDVTDVFDDMLRRSIPQYELMRELVFRVGDRYLKDGSMLVDIGCSRGEASRKFVESRGTSCVYTMIDVSDPMLDACRLNYEDQPTVSVEKFDVRFGIPVMPGAASLVIAVLSVQFTPIEYRHRILSAAYNALCDGGAFIMVEKVLGGSSYMDDLLVSEYYRMKSDNQYTQEQIKDKRASLEGVLVPVTARWNEEMLKSAGFSDVECFWRCLNFAAWVAVKK